jgi:16S rRNA (guanine966-N2)-methyltransferase
MKLRIIAGSLKRRNIVLPKALSRFRPTKEIVREAVANTLGSSIRGAIVADMCAGSGAFGFEMVSRGARAVHFIEINRALCRSITSHSGLFGVEQKCSVSSVDIRSYLKTCSFLYDIIYYDPPYDRMALAELIPDILPFLAEKGIMIFEYEKANRYCEVFTKNETAEYTTTVKKFGKTQLCYITYP